MRAHGSKKRGGGDGHKGHTKNREISFGGYNKKREVIFDPEARKQYLRGFSERKKQRRAYGLAIQKVKDRKAKLQERREGKQVELERIERAEEQKKELLAESHGLEEVEEDVTALDYPNATITSYQDVVTQSQFGGQVIVTTTTVPLSDESDDDESPPPAKKPAIDSRQRYAGKVDKFLHQLQRNMPGKKKRDSGSQPKHKGKHGAASMKGMGGSSNLKIAQKALSVMQTKKKNAVGESKKRHGGKRKR